MTDKPIKTSDQSINGQTIAELSNIYGVTKNTIQNWRKELGIETVQSAHNRIVIPESELGRFDELAQIKIAANKRKVTESDEVFNNGKLAISELQGDLIEVSELEDDELEEIRKEAEADEMIRATVYYSAKYRMRNLIASSIKQREDELRERKRNKVKALSMGRLELGK